MRRAPWRRRTREEVCAWRLLIAGPGQPRTHRLNRHFTLARGLVGRRAPGPNPIGQEPQARSPLSSAAVGGPSGPMPSAQVAASHRRQKHRG
ncbi:DUF6053 domain-containing protein [Lysobacter enzymogenes]|uniref:DUF6053 domain-containing protein n=1 Tax=Lysobacter enzymogenes TaxID=69 RepID=UPI003D189A1E